MSDAMDNLKNSLYMDRIPATWQKNAWPSMRPLSSWLTDFTFRLNQLEEWQANPADIPKVNYPFLVIIGPSDSSKPKSHESVLIIIMIP